MLERPVVLLDPCVISLVFSSCVVLFLVVVSRGCCSSLWCWSLLQFALSGNELLGLFCRCVSVCFVSRPVQVAVSSTLWEWRALSSPQIWGFIVVSLHAFEPNFCCTIFFVDGFSCSSNLSLSRLLWFVDFRRSGVDWWIGDTLVSAMFASNRWTIVVRGPYPAILYEASLPFSKILSIVSSKTVGNPETGISKCLRY